MIRNRGFEDSKLNLPKQTASRVIERPTEFEPETNGYGELADAGGGEPRHIIWLRLLWSERHFLARVTIYGAVLLTIAAFILPPKYKSVVRLMPPENQSGSGLAMAAMMSAKDSLGSMGSLGPSLAGAAGDLLGLKNSSALFVDMLQGRTIEDRMIQRFDLRKEYGDRYWDDARRHLAKHTDVEVDRKSDVMTISVEDRDPRRAQQLSQAYVDELDRLLAEVSTSAARRQRIFIEGRLQTVKQTLDRTAKEFSEYESKNTVLDMPYQAKAMVEAAAQLQGQLIVAQSELEALEQTYTTTNVRVRTLKARVDELKSQLSKLGGTSGSVDQGSNADSKTSDLYPPMRQLPLIGVRWLDLYREAKIQETVYELLTQQYELAKIQEAKEIPTIKVLDPADVPEKRSFPPRMGIIALGTLFAFCLGAAVVLGSAKWQQIDPRSPEKQFATEIWGNLREALVSRIRRGSNSDLAGPRLRGREGSQNGEETERE
jgi:capsule polysaccharide export protein KpsE/RkpR